MKNHLKYYAKLKMLRRLYDFTMALAVKKQAERALALVSFVESSIFPIPPDVMLIPMILARPERAWRLAAICTVASVLGGCLGYAIGALLFDGLGHLVLDLYGYAAQFENFQGRYNEHGVWIVLFAGLTPFPFKIITIASGVAGLSLPVFIVSSVVARGLRFFIVAALLWKFGEPIRIFIERWLGWLSALFLVLLIGGFAAVKFFV